MKNIHTDILTRTETKAISRGGSNNNNDSGPTYTTTSSSTTILGGLMEGGTTTTTVTNVETGEVVSETVETTDVMNGAYQALLNRDKDPGGGVYWTEQIRRERPDIDLSDSNSQDAVIEYLTPFFAATTCLLYTSPSPRDS